MFGLFKKKDDRIENGLFLVTVKIARGRSTEMPGGLIGALVPVFAAAPDHETAARAAVARLTAQGFEFLDIQGPIQQLEPTAWEEYTARSWPEFRDHLPSQDAVLGGIREGSVFLGPFAGYEV